MNLKTVRDRIFNNSTKLFWYSPKRAGEGNFENFGDYLAKDIVQHYSSRPVIWASPSEIRWYDTNRIIYFAAGSILKRSNRHCVIWGSGIKERRRKIRGLKKVLCVRGPETRNALIAQGYDAPEKYGDPALLLPLIYQKKTFSDRKLGLIPHYVDYQKVSGYFADTKEVVVVDLTGSVESVLEQITRCDFILSSSLHGIIVSHAYRVPCVHVEFSDQVTGDGVKFDDYFKSVGIEKYEPIDLRDDVVQRVASVKALLDKLSDEQQSLDSNILERRQTDLLDSCPFR